MTYTPDQIVAFRYWIQGYPNFYEPIVEEYFKVAGYRVLRRPALVQKPDIQRIVDALFDGYRQVGAELNAKAIRSLLNRRQRLQPDLLLEKDGKRCLVEMKSWGGSRAGVFNLSTARAGFVNDVEKGLFLLVDWVDGVPIDGKLLVVSARSAEHAQVVALLREAYRTTLEVLYLDELFTTPQLQGFIEKQLRYLDAATAELKQALQTQNARAGL